MKVKKNIEFVVLLGLIVGCVNCCVRIFVNHSGERIAKRWVGIKAFYNTNLIYSVEKTE